MVKPPKTMQPEAQPRDNEDGGPAEWQKGRRAGKSFQADSFHNYMARKIDMQRQQFGLMLPPPPVEQTAASFAPLRVASPSASPSPTKTTNRKRQGGSNIGRGSSSSSSMSAILTRLKDKHGVGNQRLERKRKRRRPPTNSALLDNTEEELMENSLISPGIDLAGKNSKETQEKMVETSLHPSPESPEHATAYDTKTLSKHPANSPSFRKSRPDLFFFGIVIKVNGYTDPDNETLKRLLQKHGGDYETYETTRITHIVAEHLSTAKANHYMKQRNPVPIVKPAWIVESVQAGCRLPHGPYLLEELKPDPQTTTIASHFAIKTYAPSKPSLESLTPCTSKASPVKDIQDASDDDDETDLVGGRMHTPCISQKHMMMTQPTTPWSGQQTQSQTPRSEPSIHQTSSILTISEEKETPRSTEIEKQPDLPAVNEQAVASPLRQEQPTQGENKQGGKTDAKYIHGKIRTVGTDPNFLDSYFGNSRLSFIGSYKQRTPANISSAAKFAEQRPRQDMSNAKRYVFHVDMDSFFASVALRNFPQYRDKPVAISHHGKKKHDTMTGPIEVSRFSTSECATCNYVAREFGIKKGMFLGRAKQLCPELVVLDYDFEGYEEVSEQVLEILHRVATEHCGVVEAVSCDEAYMSLLLDDSACGSWNTEGLKIANQIRQEIFETTDCTASIGIATNKFLAKLGTDQVKPNGSFAVEDHRRLLENLKLRDLHGIGWRSEPKLAAEGLVTVQDVWDLKDNAEVVLGRILGPGLGKKIFQFCQGNDDREVKPVERKTIGAGCNYGVRFDGPFGIDHFMFGLAKEVQRRMELVEVTGSQITLKLKQRKQGAKPPPKFLGHGSCHNLSKSISVPGSVGTCDAKILSELGMALFNELGVPLDDVRGMGLVVSKLSSCEKSGTSQFAPSYENGGGLAGWLRKATVPTRNAGATVAKDVPEADDGSMGACVQLPGKTSNDDDVELSKESRTSTPTVGIVDVEMVEHEARDGAAVMDFPMTQIELPPLSQLRMSQVDALPDSLKRQIYDRIKQREAEGVAPNSKNSPIEIDSLPLLEDSSIPTSNPTFPVESGCAKFRQTDLKRMMKLAAVKSGKVDTGISLTQLDALPLEIKLQVVNEDVAPVGTAFRRRSDILKPKRPTIPVHPRDLVATGTEYAARETIEIIGDRPSRSTTVPQRRENVRPRPDPLPEGPDDLYEEDILPFQVFLDNNSFLDNDAMDQVVKFLTVVVREERIRDVTILIRSMRNRKDGWSSGCVLKKILNALDQEHLTKFGSRADFS